MLMRLYAQPTPAFAAGPVALGKALTMLRATCAAAGRRLQAGQGTWGQALATRMNSLGGGLALASVALQTITSPNAGPRRKPECRRS